MNDERELYATNDKSEFDLSESVNQSDFRFAKNCQILTTFELVFKRPTHSYSIYLCAFV